MRSMRYLLLVLLFACSKPEECEKPKPALEISIESSYGWQYMRIYDWYYTTTTGTQTFTEYPSGTYNIEIGAGPTSGRIEVEVKKAGSIIYSLDTIGNNPLVSATVEF